MLPLGCLPLWGREGVTLLAAAENKRITGKRGFQQSQIITKMCTSAVTPYATLNGSEQRILTCRFSDVQNLKPHFGNQIPVLG
jgi:hypothetical protein